MSLPRLTGVPAVLAVLAFVTPGVLAVQRGPAPADLRSERLQDADHWRWAPPDPFPTRAAWEARARDLRQKVRLAAGLWPEREPTPLNARVFDVKESDGFRVGKVHFESLPGFYATGNIFYPASGSGPFPAVLTPHGHWQYGRLQNSASGSVMARSIDFARQGYVVFAIDMVGYNDSFQLPHDGSKSRAQLVADAPLPYEPRLFRADFDFPEAALYGFNLGGVQLWNSIRALDFLSSLPEVDGSRIGVTGASGGATQTLLLMAADDRVKVAAPVNIIGAEKQPGCSCENLPGLWIGTSTIEVAATFAPRPLLLVSATDDPWTNSTPTRELPIIRRYYDLFGAGGQLANTHVKAGHNYNAESRAAVYAFFRKHLNPPGPAIDAPPPVAVELKSLGDLRVFPDTVLPKSARTGRQVAQGFVRSASDVLGRAFPADAGGLASFRSAFRPALALVMNVERPAPASVLRAVETEETRDGWVLTRERIGRDSEGDSIDIESIRRASGTPAAAVLLLAPESYGRLTPGAGLAVVPGVRALADSGQVVYRVRGYASGQLRIPERTYDSFAQSAAYNRPNEVLAVQDALTALAAIRQARPAVRISVIGLGESGVAAALAAAIDGGASRLIVDLNRDDPGYDRTFRRLMPVGAVRSVGDFRTALLLVDGPVHLLNPGPTFDRSWYVEQGTRSGLRVTVHDTVDLTSTGAFGTMF
jgi:dienelactone hydrolase